MAKLIKDIEEVIKELGYKNCILVGHDGGGSNSLVFCLCTSINGRKINRNEYSSSGKIYGRMRYSKTTFKKLVYIFLPVAFFT